MSVTKWRSLKASTDKGSTKWENKFSLACMAATTEVSSSIANEYNLGNFSHNRAPLT
jgi:hypothetical protein